MPIIKSAKKKMRKDLKKKAGNKAHEQKLLKSVKAVFKGKGDGLKDLVSKAQSAIDKAAKKNIIHKNKARRLKARVSKTAR